MSKESNIKVEDKVQIIIESEVDRLFKLAVSPVGLEESDLKKLDTLAKIWRQHKLGADEEKDQAPMQLDSLLSMVTDDKK